MTYAWLGSSANRTLWSITQENRVWEQPSFALSERSVGMPSAFRTRSIQQAVANLILFNCSASLESIIFSVMYDLNDRDMLTVAVQLTGPVVGSAGLLLTLSGVLVAWYL